MFESPLRYPGGKGRLAQYVIDLIEMNGLVGGQYIEPYAGGAGVALSLLYLEYASSIHLNDLNKSIYAFWKCVLEHSDELCRRIRDAALTYDEWQRQKAVQSTSDPDLIDLGFSTLYLNRTNRSGIIKGGVIGGKNQDGPWKIDARFKKDEIINRIQKVARFSARIHFSNLDAITFLRSTLVKSVPVRKSLVYLDPPYYWNGRRLYQNNYKAEGHLALYLYLMSLRHKWIVSYDDVPPVRDMYSHYRQQTFGLLYSAKASYTGREVMIFGDNVKVPGSVIPWRGIAA